MCFSPKRLGHSFKVSAKDHILSSSCRMDSVVLSAFCLSPLFLPLCPSLLLPLYLRSSLPLSSLSFCLPGHGLVKTSSALCLFSFISWKFSLYLSASSPLSLPSLFLPLSFPLYLLLSFYFYLFLPLFPCLIIRISPSVFTSPSHFHCVDDSCQEISLIT